MAQVDNVVDKVSFKYALARKKIRDDLSELINNFNQRELNMNSEDKINETINKLIEQREITPYND